MVYKLWKDNFSEILGYILIIIGLLLLWLKFDWIIALSVGFIAYGIILSLGVYLKLLADILVAKIDQKYK